MVTAYFECGLRIRTKAVYFDLFETFNLNRILHMSVNLVHRNANDEKLDEIQMNTLCRQSKWNAHFTQNASAPEYIICSLRPDRGHTTGDFP